MKPKLVLRQLADLPDVLQKSIVDLSGVREAGLRNLSNILQTNNVASKAQDILRGWLSEDARLRSVRASLQDRLIGRRHWLYRNIAAFLTGRYRTIAIEDEFAAKAMIEDTKTKDRDLRFQRSIRHYQWAAVAELRTYILEAAIKKGTRIIEINTRGSTTTCFICGRYSQHQPNLKLTCPSGHTWDQDVNAASNILNGVGGLNRNQRQSSGL
jgi:transposase